MPDIANVAEEIEITPEMVEAGVSALLDYDSRFEGEDTAVVRVFEAMLGARVKTAPSPSSGL